MPGQNTVVAQHYQDEFQTISFPLHGSTITRGAVTPLFYLEKDIVIDDVRLITRIAGASGLTLDVGFLPGATPAATWVGTVTPALSTTLTIASTTSGSLNVGDRLANVNGAVITGIPADAYITAFGTYPASLTGTVTISATGTATSTVAGAAMAWKSVLTAPMAAATDNVVVVGAVNANIATIPTAAPSNLVVTTGNNIVAGPTTSNNTTTLGNVLSILASGAATTAYNGTLQIRYRTRVA